MKAEQNRIILALAFTLIQGCDNPSQVLDNRGRLVENTSDVLNPDHGERDDAKGGPIDSIQGGAKGDPTDSTPDNIAFALTADGFTMASPSKAFVDTLIAKRTLVTGDAASIIQADVFKPHNPMPGQQLAYQTEYYTEGLEDGKVKGRSEKSEKTVHFDLPYEKPDLCRGVNKSLSKDLITGIVGSPSRQLQSCVGDHKFIALPPSPWQCQSYFLGTLRPTPNAEIKGYQVVCRMETDKSSYIEAKENQITLFLFDGVASSNKTLSLREIECTQVVAKSSPVDGASACELKPQAIGWSRRTKTETLTMQTKGGSSQPLQNSVMAPFRIADIIKGVISYFSGSEISRSAACTYNPLAGTAKLSLHRQIQKGDLTRSDSANINMVLANKKFTVKDAKFVAGQGQYSQQTLTIPSVGSGGGMGVSYDASNPGSCMVNASKIEPLIYKFSLACPLRFGLGNVEYRLEHSDGSSSNMEFLCIANAEMPL